MKSVYAKGVMGSHGSKYLVIFEQGEINTPILMLPEYEAKKLLADMQNELKEIQETELKKPKVSRTIKPKASNEEQRKVD